MPPLPWPSIAPPFTILPERTEGLDRRQGQGTRHQLKLARYPAQRGHHGGGRDAAKPTLAEICILSQTTRNAPVGAV